MVSKPYAIHLHYLLFHRIRRARQRHYTCEIFGYLLRQPRPRSSCLEPQAYLGSLAARSVPVSSLVASNSAYIWSPHRHQALLLPDPSICSRGEGDLQVGRPPLVLHQSLVAPTPAFSHALSFLCFYWGRAAPQSVFVSPLPYSDDHDTVPRHRPQAVIIIYYWICLVKGGNLLIVPNPDCHHYRSR